MIFTSNYLSIIRYEINPVTCYNDEGTSNNQLNSFTEENQVLLANQAALPIVSHHCIPTTALSWSPACHLTEQILDTASLMGQLFSIRLIQYMGFLLIL